MIHIEGCCQDLAEFLKKFSKQYVSLEPIHIKTWVSVCVRMFAKILIMVPSRRRTVWLFTLYIFCTIHIFFARNIY